ncbi:hypothetical protein [Kribbella sp. NPDC006257]|uniref:hypothetical protein n=1 Tax=Kribbella sp. NPDC006257 TaxID=3156738 RepID=UPI0033AC6BE8
MRRSIAVGCGVLLLAGWQVPSASAAVSGVQVAWVDATHAKVRITWSESTPSANTLALETDGGGEPLSLGSVPVGAPNELLVNTSYLGYTNYPDVSRVVVSDPAGGSASSVGFDRYSRPGGGPNFSFAPQGGVKWDFYPDPYGDSTPNDPLDVTGGTKYTVRLRYDKQPHVYGDCGEVLLPASTATNGVIPDNGQPAAVAVLTSNEWNPKPRGDDGSAITTTSLTIAAPTVTAYGTPLTLTGTGAYHDVLEGGTVVCRQRAYPLASVLVALQGRNSPTSAWYVVGSTQMDGTGKYSFSLPNPGAREYRVVYTTTAGGANAIMVGATTVTKAVKATTRVMSAKFISPVITYGTKPQAYLWVDPANTQRAALQFKNASGVWQGVSYKTLYAGKGLLQFSWSKRGATQFRWYVPASTHNSLPVAAVYSGVFTLTVR